MASEDTITLSKMPFIFSINQIPQDICAMGHPKEQQCNVEDCKKEYSRIFKLCVDNLNVGVSEACDNNAPSQQEINHLVASFEAGLLNSFKTS